MCVMQQELELDARRKIYNVIQKSPGLHFREIQRRLNVATGSLDYHIHFLYKHGLLRQEKDGKYTRYYALTRNWDTKEKEMLSLLRQKRVRHILIFLIEKKSAAASDIATTLGMTPSTLSWYLKQLAEKNIITLTKRGRFRFYKVVDKESIIKCLVTHKASFLDAIVDNFIETWEEDLKK